MEYVRVAFQFQRGDKVWVEGGSCVKIVEVGTLTETFACLNSMFFFIELQSLSILMASEVKDPDVSHLNARKNNTVY